MEEELRKVLFNLGDVNARDFTVGDLEDDKEGVLKERNGLFHCWGEEVYYDSENGKKFQRTVAIVEEEKTGRIYKVAPQCMIFKKDYRKAGL